MSCAAAAAVAGALLVNAGVGAQQQVIGGTNVNMVSGTSFPDGDPFLQRQNEPSSAASTRNPMHLLAGANDYRTVDIPGPLDPLKGFEANADAWAGLFKSFDGGQTWHSTLLPGYPQDTSTVGKASRIYHYQAATDPVVRAGSNGLFYYAGIAFNRGDNQPSAVYVARFIDLNNDEAGDPIAYLGDAIVASSASSPALDKTALAVDIPRTTATCTIQARQKDGTPVPQTVPAGTVYVAYSAFTGSGSTTASQIMVSRSVNCGATWSTPISISAGTRLNQNAQIAIDPSSGAVYVSWRVFKSGTQGDGVYIAKSTNQGVSFGKAVRIAPVYPFDQPTSTTIFRSNGFQTMTVDASGRVYVAWTERGHATQRPDVYTGDARVVISTSATGTTWTTPQPIRTDGLGHQLMPALSFHAGRLRLVYYDLREDVSQVFAQYVDEAQAQQLRHTLDVYVAQAAPAAVPSFTSVKLSDYPVGYLPGSSIPQQLQFNPPNLPLFRQGTVPFMGDYLDLAAAPSMVQGANGQWTFNTQAGESSVAHAFWTDNRDVRPPSDGNWTNYTPVVSDALQGQSRFDPSQTTPQCVVGHTGMRNQNIYTARISEGLFVGAPGNTKPLGTIPRAFVVTVQNEGAASRSYRLTIANQPPNGSASFTQFTLATIEDITVPAYSTVARSVYASSSQVFPAIRVNVTEITAPGGGPVSGGQTGTVLLNADASNPSIQNPSVQNPSVQNPSVQNAEVYNPSIQNAIVANPSIQNPSIQNTVLNPSVQNPSIQNPSIQNPSLQNDSVANPDIVNPSIQNPSVQNPSVQNPSLQNPSVQNADVVNGAIDDTTWQITNNGNTTASYAIKLVLTSPLPAGFSSQLILHKSYSTPAAQDCTLALQPHTILLANIPNPTFLSPQDPSIQNPSIQNPSVQNPTISLAPGETANVTLRVVDPNRFDGTSFEAAAAVVPAAVAHSVNTEDAAQGITQPPVAIAPAIITPALVSAAPGAPYQQTLQTFATTPGTAWSVTQGSLPPGLLLDPATGTISGTPTAPGNYVFTVQSTDATGRTATRQMSIQINPPAPAGYDKIWNGASTNWSDPKNWSPNGVPQAADSVYVAAGLPFMPSLTQNVTVRNLWADRGATITATGYVLTVLEHLAAGNAIVGGLVDMPGALSFVSGGVPSLSIEGHAMLLGPIAVSGDLTLGPGATLTLSGLRAAVSGSLITNAPSAPPAVESDAPGTLEVGGLNVNGLDMRNVFLAVNGDALVRFDAARFSGFSRYSTADQLTITSSGTASPLTFSGVSFAAGTSGRYVFATKTPGALPLVINFLDAVPADGSSRTAVAGGAVVNWLQTPGTANLSVSQTVSGTLLPGSPLTYTIVVTNGGPAAASNVVLRDALPGGATFVSASAGCSLDAPNVFCSFPQVLVNEAFYVQIVVTPGSAGTFVNTASVSGSTSDPVPGNNTTSLAIDVLSLESAADLSVTQSGSPASVAPGQTFSYVLRVHNGGPAAASQIVLRDDAPAGVSFSSAVADRGTCIATAGTLTCGIPSLAVNADATITLTAVAGPAAGLLANYVSVSGANGDPNTTNNVSVQFTMVTQACAAPEFGPPTTLSAFGGNVFQLTAVDVDGNDTKDLMVSLGGTTYAFLNDGAGHFTATPGFSFATQAFGFAVANYNTNVHPDIAVVGTLGSAGKLWVFYDGTFNGPTIDLGAVTPFTVVSGDFNEDGHPDLAVEILNSPNLLIFLNDGNGGFGSPTTVPTSANVARIATADVNGDGHADLIAGQAGPFVSVLLGDGRGGFAAPQNIPVSGGNTVVRAVGDLNKDGRPDLVVVETINGQSGLAVLLGDGSGGFGPDVVVRTAQSNHTAAIADINGDGNPDLVTDDVSTNVVLVMLGDGAGHFGTPVGFAAPAFSTVIAADLDGDGRPDIANGDTQGNLRVFFNTCGQPATDLSITVTDSADPVSEGDTITYTATVRNLTGVAANNLVVTATVSGAGASIAQSGSSVGGALTNYAGRTATWEVPTLAANATATFGYSVTTASGGTATFTAGASASGADSNPPDNLAIETTTVNAVGRIIYVTNTNDSGPGSLRQAITDSNADSGDVDRVYFNIDGPTSIAVLTALPTITQPVIIDGTTQPGANGRPVVELNGAAAPSGNGLLIGAGISGSTIRGLTVNRFKSNGISVAGSGNVIAGNHVGTSVDGMSPLPNSSTGINVTGANNMIGGTAAGDGNLASGNGFDGIFISGAGATGNQVAGNLVGTNAPGTAPLPNGNAGVQVVAGTGNTIGGPTPAHRNLISGGAINGVSLRTGASNNLVQGNWIGLAADGTTALPNGAVGVFIGESPSNSIVNNVVSGNLSGGIGIGNAGANGNSVRGNRVGTSVNGDAAVPNSGGGGGVYLFGGAHGTVIGGEAAGEGNLISGNSNTGIGISGTDIDQTTVRGNVIGLNAAQTASLGNQDNGVYVGPSATNTVVGGRLPGAGNVIAGDRTGIFVDAAGTLIQGNLIGLNTSGVARANEVGITVNGNVTGTTIGGTTAGAGNTIAGNTSGGIASLGAGTVIQGNRIGINAAGSPTPNGTGISSSGSNVVIGGTDAGARNVISGNTREGILLLLPGSGALIQGNYIGTSLDGTSALPNFTGISVSSANATIGGATSNAGNVISGNSVNGVVLNGANGSVVQGNLIGPNAAGTGSLGNGTGITIVNGLNNTIGGTAAGAGNFITGNGSGVDVSGTSTGNAILGNDIFTPTVRPAIDLNADGITANDTNDTDTGPNNLQNFPVLTSAIVGGGVTIVQGTLNSSANTTYRVEFFATSFCPGGGPQTAHFLGATTVTISGDNTATFIASMPSVSAGWSITATATDDANNTSEPSACFTATTAVPFAATNTNDSGPGSLRQAIVDANAGTGTPNISFNMPGSGVHTITLQSALPALARPVTIDGTTQPGYIGAPLIELNGNGLSGAGLTVNGGASRIRGLVVNNFGGTGILLSSDGNTVDGNFIGVDPSGLSARPNAGHGISITGAQNTIGGTTAGAANFIAGNNGDAIYVFGAAATANVIQGNRIGSSATDGFFETFEEPDALTGSIASQQNGTATVTTGQNHTPLGTHALTLTATAAGDKNVVVQGDVNDSPSHMIASGYFYDAGAGLSTSFDMLNSATGFVTSIGTLDSDASCYKASVTLPGNDVHGPNASVSGCAAGVANTNVRRTAGWHKATVVSDGQNVTLLIDERAVFTLAGDYGVDNVRVSLTGSGTGPAAFFDDFTFALAGTTLPNGRGIEIVDAPGTTVGGTSPEARNVISGNGNEGVLVSGSAPGTVITGNYIGSSGTGHDPIGNGIGIAIQAANVTVGGSAAGAGNLIEGSVSHGISITGAGNNAVIQGNTIGPNAALTFADGNLGAGVFVGPNVTGTLIGGTASGSGNVIAGSQFADIAVQGINTTIQGNTISTDPKGTESWSNGNGGISIASTATGTLIGGTEPGARNLISGASMSHTGAAINIAGQNTVVAGNYIGTNAAGEQGPGNGSAGISLAATSATTLVGGTATGSGNVVSGSAFNGVVVNGTSNLVFGNRIGTNASGTTAIPNGWSNLGHGVVIVGTATGTRIGVPGVGNLISGNAAHGIVADGTDTQIVANVIGLNAAGTAAIPNNGSGILTNSGSHGIRIGGGAFEGNVISGNGVGISLANNGNGHTVKGNLIGTNVTGTAAVGNQRQGINITSPNNAIGGGDNGDRNVISGNVGQAVQIGGATATGNVVQGNWIGLNAAGNAAIPNQAVQSGIFVQDAANNTIGGSVPGAGNVVSGNTQHAITICCSSAANGNVVQGNLVGTLPDGVTPLPNGTNGSAIGIDIVSAVNTTVGGAAGAGNLVANNGTGVQIRTGATGNVLKGNTIRNNTGLGVRIDTTSGNTIGGTGVGDGNTIQGNNGPGVTVINATSANNAILGNSISGNGGLGIDLNSDGVTANDATDADTGANGLQNYPVLTSATISGATTVVQGTLTSASSTSYRVEFFASPTCDPSGFGEGTTFLGSTSVAIAANNSSSFSLSLPVIVETGAVLTATATDPSGNTSEFSPCVTVQSGTTSFAVTNTNDSGAGSLRQAILDANAHPGADTIMFSVGGGGLQTITPASPLPTITDSVMLDATSQPGYNGKPLIELDGTNAGGTANGLMVSASNTTIRGFVVNRFGTGGAAGSGGGAGIVFVDPGTGNALEGNYVGTDSSGSIALPNRNDGVWTNNGGNRIGGPAAAARNVISANGRYGVVIIGGSNPALTTVTGNFVGTTAQSGDAPLGNESDGLFVSAKAQIDSNVVAGNKAFGMTLGLGAIGSQITTNHIGVGNALTGVPNQYGGINVVGASGNTFSGNTIAFNNGNGVSVNSGAGNNFTSNSIYANVGLGIDLAPSSDSASSSFAVDFEDQPDSIPFFQAFPTSYQGITWTNWSHYAPYGNGYQPHGVNAIFAAVDGAKFTFSPRVFLGASISRLPGAPGNVFFELYRNGSLVWTSAVLNDTPPQRTFLPSGYPLMVDEVRVRSLGSSMTPNGSAWIMDDVLFANGVNANDAGDGDSGANNLQNYPVLSAAVVDTLTTTVQGTLNSTANSTFRLEFFSTQTCNASGNGEGLRFLGSSSVTTVGNTTSFSASLPVTTIGTSVTATATDAAGNTSEFSVCMPVTGTDPNTPTANAGPDQSVNAGDTVQLNGSGSSDPQQRPLTYLWSFDSLPTGSASSFSGTNTATPTFVTDLPGTYVARLIVNNGVANSVPDTVSIHTNSPPIARAGPDQAVPVGATVQLDGSQSSDPENSPLSFHWIFNTRPSGSLAQLSNPNIVNPTFIADLPGSYALQLVVNDGLVNSASDGIIITTLNRAPVANAGPDQANVPINATVQLDGSGSSDPDGTALTYAWSFVSRPSGSTTILFNPTTAAPTFTADRPGRYRINLTVSDGQAGASDTVDVTTVNSAPIANAGSDQTVHERALVTLNGGASSDADGNPLTYAWTLVSTPTGSTAQLANANAVSPTFTADLPGAYTVRLVVNDTIVDSAPDDVVITALSSAMTLALVDTPLVGAGRQATLRVTLPWAAPIDGVVVALTSDDRTIVTVQAPGSVTIPEGQSAGDVIINGVATGTTTMRASAPAYADGQLQVSVTQNILSAPATLNVALGNTASFPVTIPTAAPTGGVVVTLTSSDANLVQVLTPTITIPQGSVAANGTVKGASPGTATVTASRTGYSSASSQVSTTAQLNIIETSASLRPSFPTSITIRLDSGGVAVAAPAPGITVTLITANPACVATNSPRTIPTGLISIDASVNYGGSAALPCTTTLTAQSPGITPETISVTVNPDPGISLSGSSVGSGLQYGTFSGSLAEAQHGGVTVHLASSSGALLKLSPNSTTAGTDTLDIAVPNGQSSFTYWIQGMESVTGDVTLTATAPHFSNGTATIHVVAPAIEIQGLAASATSLDPNHDFYVRVGVPGTSGSTVFMSALQAMRVGGPGLTATLTNSNGAVAQLVTQAGSGQTRTVTLAPGQQNSPTALSSGGVSFDPLAAGSTQVTVSAAGFTLTTSNGSVGVTVTAPGITLSSSSVGSGLQYGSFSGALDGSQHGGVTVHLASSSGALLKLSPNSTTAGTDALDIFVANGQTSFTYWIQGMESVTGDATITASAPQFTNGTATVHVMTPAIEIQGLGTTATSLDSNNDFYARVGLPGTSGSTVFMNILQALRVGGPGLTATLSNSNGAVAQLVTQAGTGQARTVTIAPGQQNSPTTLAAGGVSFDALAAGTTQVTVSASGFTPTTSNGSVGVTVTAPGITLSSSSVGSGLQYGTFSGTLGGSQHGGVTVHLASSNGALLKLSPNSTTAGTDSLDIPVANGQTSFNYWIQAMESVTGDATITATAPQFTNGTSTIHVMTPAIEIQGLATTATSLDPNNDFYVRVGLPGTSGTTVFMNTLQALRVGGPGLTATIANSNGAVAQLVTQTGTGQTRTVTIAPGQQNSPTTLSTGGISFDPIGGGTTQVAVSATGFVPTTSNGSLTVTVSAPGITISGTSVGSGLQYGTFSGSLGGSQHGGVNVHLASSNPAVMRVAPDASTAGTAAIDVFVANGQTSFSYWVQGVEGATGGTTLTASAPGFTDRTATIQVVQPALEIQALPSSVSSLDPDDPFYVRVGVPTPDHTAMSILQAIRSGGTPVTATLSNSAAAVGQLTTQTGSSQVRTVTVSPGQVNSPTTVSTGGVAFDPLSAGATTVTASAAGFGTTNQSAVQISVRSPGISFSSPTTTVGSGLQYGTFSGTLDGSQHGGVTVRITSSNPALVKVAKDNVTAGDTFVDIPVANGQTTFNYWVQAMDGVTGTATLTASAPQFADGAATVTVVPPALQIVGLRASFNATDATVAFTVQLGVPDSAGSALTAVQAVRVGSSATVTVSNSNGTAAQLVTLAGGAQSGTVVIAGGASNSPSSVASGGVGFDPLQSGTTTVRADSPAFLTTARGIVVVTIQP